MQESFPWPSAAATGRSSPADAPSAHGESDLQALWTQAMTVLSTVADTPSGIPLTQLRYVIHCVVRSGSSGQHAALVGELLRRTFSSDLRLVDLLLQADGSSASQSLLHCLLPLLAGEEGKPACPEVRVLVLMLLGRVMTLSFHPYSRATPEIPSL